MTRITLTGLTKTFTDAAGSAVRHVTLDVACGELMALLGPSGCGKTTIMRMIAGLLPPTAGSIAFDDIPLGDTPPEQRGAVMVFQNPLLFPYLSVAENVGFGLKMRRLPRDAITARVNDMLARVQLPGFGDRRPQALSGGQQARVALARALVTNPRVLLLDEPLASLDSHLRADMRDLIRTIQRDLGLTTLLVTHDQEEAVVMADRIALMRSGEIMQVAPPADFYTRPGDADTARFFGARNFVPGHASNGVFHSALGPLTLPAGTADGPATLTIRPEAIRLIPATSSAPNTRTATLNACDFLGTQTRLRLTIANTPIEALIPPADAATLTKGCDVTLCLPPAALWLIRSPSA